MKAFPVRRKAQRLPFFVFGCISTIIIRGDLLHPYSFLMKDFKCGCWYFLVLFYCYLTNYALSFFDLSNSVWMKIAKLLSAIAIWKVVGNFCNNYVSIAIVDVLCLNPYLLWIVPYFFVGNFIKNIGWTEIIVKKMGS